MEFGTLESRKRKRKSRWANDESEKLFIPGMPTTLPADATEDQKEQYLLQLQIEESTRRLRSGDLGIPAKPEERSPSPEPIYNSEGKRMNTREYRTRKTLEEQRHERIQILIKLNDNYKPPADYKPPAIRVNDKVMIPQDNHPEINFVGLLIGPRGNTLKNLEKETGAKIIIRGKGSVKEGKIGRKDGQPMPGEDEPLHAYVTANDPACVTSAVNKIHEIIKEGIEIPEENNDLRKQQLRELALLNGTLRDNDGIQKLRQIAEAQTIVTNTIICTKCGGAGHIAGDCTFRAPADLALVASQRGEGDIADARAGRQDRAKMDSEYMSLMAELGQVAPGTVRDQLQAQMPRHQPPVPLMDIHAKPSRSDNPNGQENTGSNQPSLSSDYGYGGKRSRFESFQSSPRGGYGSPAPNRNPGPANFNNPNIRFNNGGNNSFNENSNSSRTGGFNNGPPAASKWGSPAPPGPPSANRWSSPLPPPPGPPSFHSGAPPPSGPPNSGGFGNPPGPPPRPPGGYRAPAPSPSHPWQAHPAPRGNAPPPWQSGGNAPPPPWQSNYGSPAAPPAPPPPPSSTAYNQSSYGGYNQPPQPPPPPPQ